MLLSWLNPRKEISSDSFDFHVDACIGMRNIGEIFATDRGERDVNLNWISRDRWKPSTRLNALHPMLFSHK